MDATTLDQKGLRSNALISQKQTGVGGILSHPGDVRSFFLSRTVKTKNLSQLQEQFLQTGDMSLVEKLYRTLVAIGLTVQRESKDPSLNQDPDAVLDIASSVCIRLISKREVVVTYASAYMKRALFFMNKKTFHDSLDEREYEAPTSQEFDAYDNYINNLGIDESTEVGALVLATLRSRLSLEKVAKNLDPVTEREFRKEMEVVKKYVEENLQGSGMYKACGC